MLSLDHIFDELNQIRNYYEFSHVGAVPKLDDTTLVWALNHPNPTLYVVNHVTYSFKSITRSEWEKLTFCSPPWPWVSTGLTLNLEGR